METTNQTNINILIRRLNQEFYNATNTSNIKNDQQLFDYQTEYTYLIDDIQRGPAYKIRKRINQINQLIDEIKLL